MLADSGLMFTDRSRRNAIGGVLLGLRMVIGGVLLYAGLEKMLGGLEFFTVISMYQLGGLGTNLLLASVVPGVELVVGLTLMAGILHREAFLAGLICSAGFVAAQFSVIHRGLSVPCGCFGGESGSEFVGARTVVVASMLLVGCLAGFLLSRTLEKSDQSESSGEAAATIRKPSEVRLAPAV